MLKGGTPFLAQFATFPQGASSVPELCMDESSGLLHRVGERLPFVEELVLQKGKWLKTAYSETLLTESSDDPDPDLVRNDCAFGQLDVAFSTLITRQDGDESDPDLMRDECAQLVLARLSSHVTKQATDDPDPDLIRASASNNFPFS